jgi:ribosomal-protein-alanine N-acetyltransferase
MTDEEATLHLNFDKEQKTPEGARELLEYVVESYETTQPVFALAITERSNKAYLGSCGLSPLADDPEGVECYFWLLPRYWGWGYATEAMRALLYFAFVEMGIARVVTNVPKENERARRVAENAGMVDIGPAEAENRPASERFSITNEQYATLYKQAGR